MKFSLTTKHQDAQNLVLPISSLDLYPQMLKINVTIVQVVQELYYFCLLTTSSLLPKKPEALEA